MSLHKKFGPQEPVVSKKIYECGICSGYHPWDWDGDCRDDSNRFGSPEEYEGKYGLVKNSIEVLSMEDRIREDGHY